jgi:HD-GYP domain-containing protein (c-di-GMP phosphodiesterase class II)
VRLRLSLPTRIFVFAVISISAVAGASAWILNRAIRARIEDRLEESFRMSEHVLDTTATRYRNRSTQMLSVLRENAGLKASLGLWREFSPGKAGAAEIRKKIETTLFELGKGLEYQLMLVTDSSGQPVAGTVTKPWGSRPLNPLPTVFQPSALIEIQGTLYEATTVPINLGTENLGSLTVAREFDIATDSPTDQSVLMSKGRIIRSTFPDSELEEIGSQLNQQCTGNVESCGIRIKGENFLALPLERADWGSDERLFGFQSLDAAMADFTRDFWGEFAWVGLAGMIGAVMVAFVGARSISKPITNLILRLKASQKTGLLHADFPENSAVEEVNLLAHALNGAAQALADSQQHLEDASVEFLETMARALDARDPYTAGHSDRVSANSTAIAQAMGLPAAEVEIIRVGARMHDIGKIGVPDRILQKAGPLTEEEFALIKLHPQIGKRILEKVGTFREYLPIVELHHEDFNGGGYPYGLTGEQVSLGIRIVHVADVYDALTSDRAYRAAMPPEQVRAMLVRGSGTQFDPDVVEIFLSILQERAVLEQLLTQVHARSRYEPAGHS